MKKSINLNVLLAEHVVTALEQLGVREVVISPGSRSTPLVIAFDASRKTRSHVVIDERSNGYFALGLAKASKRPVAIVTTSGTAAAELYPAVIEAYHQRIPLIICSADRPAHLVNTGANQTIDQTNLYGNFSKYFIDSGIPKLSKVYFKKLNNEFDKICNLVLNDDTGPVQINLRFAKPLEKFSTTHTISGELLNIIKSADIFTINKKIPKIHSDSKAVSVFSKLISSSGKILIMVGPADLTNTEIKSIYKIAHLLNAFIIADGLSGIRTSGIKNKSLLCNATAFIRNRNFINHYDADLIIQFGGAPTSNILLKFFRDSNSKKILVNSNNDVKDPSHTFSQLLKMSINEFYEFLRSANIRKTSKDSNWTKGLLNFEYSAQDIKTRIIEHSRFPKEPRIIMTLLDSIPANSNLMISNSIAPRDVDYFSDNYNKFIKIYHNRGTSGIDGIISTAAGIQSSSNTKTFLLIGDLAFMHDLNGLWLLKKYNIPLTIILINNGGGSIFEMLPVKNEKVDFEKYFKVPPDINFKNLTKSFSGSYLRIKSWSHLSQSIKRTNTSFRVLEIKTNSTESLNLRKRYWKAVISETQKFIDENTGK